MNRQSAGAKVIWPIWVRWSSAPASTRVVRRVTSSSSQEPVHQDKVHWGAVNQPMSEEHFDQLYKRLMAYLQGRDLFVQDCFAGADETYRLPVRVITETAWHNLFVRNMFIQASDQELAEHIPQFTVIQAPNFHAVPAEDGTNSEVFVVVHFDKKLVLIGGTQYAGEIKKSIFSVMNYLLPMQGVLPMHCSANVGMDDDVAIFFGLSGTGKTTLSTDPARILIGDDEHGWSDSGIFNMEGGCYAKTIRLSPTAEPDIYAATRKFGTILENVGYDTTNGRIDLDDDSLDREHAGGLPDQPHPQCDTHRVGQSPQQCHHADGRCLWRFAADLEIDA